MEETLRPGRRSAQGRSARPDSGGLLTGAWEDRGGLVGQSCSICWTRSAAATQLSCSGLAEWHWRELLRLGRGQRAHHGMTLRAVEWALGCTRRPFAMRKTLGCEVFCDV